MQVEAFLIPRSFVIGHVRCIPSLCVRPHVIAPHRPQSFFLSMSNVSTTVAESSELSPNDFTSREQENKNWVDTQRIRSALSNNHFMDVLDVNGSYFGLKKDQEYDGFDEGGCFSLRMQKLGKAFRHHVIGAFARRVGLQNVTCVSEGSVRSAGTYERFATKKAILRKDKLIVGGIVGDEQRRILSRIPLLIRLDVAINEFGIDIPIDDLQKETSDVYIAMGMKRRQLDANENGIIRRSSLDKMQIEMWLWNRLLADTQGCDVGYALLMGLNRKRKKPIEQGAIPKKENSEENSLHTIFDTRVWKLGMIKYSKSLCRRGAAALEALKWRIDVEDHGREWAENGMKRFKEEGQSCCPNTNVNPIYALSYFARDVRLRPNMKCASMYDYPWAKVKQKIAVDLCDLTLVSGISQQAMIKAINSNKSLSYYDEEIKTTDLEVKSNFTKQTLIKLKPGYNGPSVTPSLIPHNRSNWRRLQDFNPENFQKFDKHSAQVEMAEERTFYVDFELASPELLYPQVKVDVVLNNSNNVLIQHANYFDTQPRNPIQSDVCFDAYIFMIGCGQVINGEWKHKVFIADNLSRIAESKIVRDWLLYMHAKIPHGSGPPFLFVWGPEQKLMRKAFSRMEREDKEVISDMREYKHVNMLSVVQTACLSIQGSLSNSIKSVVTGLENLGLLEEFGGRPNADLIQNGSDAMALGLEAAQIAHQQRLQSMASVPKMNIVTAYNEADCRDIARIVSYLQKNH